MQFLCGVRGLKLVACFSAFSIPHRNVLTKGFESWPDADLVVAPEILLAPSLHPFGFQSTLFYRMFVHPCLWDKSIKPQMQITKIILYRNYQSIQIGWFDIGSSSARALIRRSVLTSQKLSSQMSKNPKAQNGHADFTRPRS
jgi:hypothetical protein